MHAVPSTSADKAEKDDKIEKYEEEAKGDKAEKGDKSEKGEKSNKKKSIGSRWASQILKAAYHPNPYPVKPEKQFSTALHVITSYDTVMTSIGKISTKSFHSLRIA